MDVSRTLRTMHGLLVTVGVACIIAAVIGGGLKAFGIEFPALTSAARQVMLGVLGVCFIAIGSDGGATAGAVNEASTTAMPVATTAEVGADTAPSPSIGSPPAAGTVPVSTSLPSAERGGEVVPVPDQFGAIRGRWASDDSVETMHHAVLFVTDSGGTAYGQIEYGTGGGNRVAERLTLERISDTQFRLVGSSYWYITAADTTHGFSLDTLTLTLSADGRYLRGVSVDANGLGAAFLMSRMD